MQFFKLTHPDYSTEREAERRNPAVSTASHSIPGIRCDECGTWSSSARIRVPLPPQADDFLGVRFLAPGDWSNARSGWSKLLGVDVDLIEPGAKLGPPSGTCSGRITEDAVHPIPGEIWVTARVRDVLAGAGLKGLAFADVQLPPECGEAKLSELVVRGRAWRPGSTEAGLRLCDICGRRGFPSPKNLAVDEARWDGSDFLFLDHNPNIIVVSARAAELLDENAFTNLIAVPIS